MNTPPIPHPPTSQPSVDSTETPLAIIIERPNELRQKIGGSLNPSLVQKAENAVSNLAQDFEQWLGDAVSALHDARQKLITDTEQTVAGSGFDKAALEVKSLGETYGYPLITRISHSLFRLIVKTPQDQKPPMALLDAHVDAIRALLRDKVRDAHSPIGNALASELEKRVAEITKD